MTDSPSTAAATAPAGASRPPGHREPPSAWGTIREAIRGSHQDYTEAPIGRAVTLLAVPMVLEILVCLWLWEIPLAWVLAYPLGVGPTGVFIAVSVAFSTLALVSGWLFSKGNWKTKKV